MATIFSSSDTAPLNSDITAVLQLLFSTYYLLEANYSHLVPQRIALRAVRVCVRAQGPWFHCGWTCHCHLACLRPMLLLCAASERRREGNSDEVWEERTWRCRLGCSLWLPFLHLLRVSAAPIIGGWAFSSFANLQLQHAGVEDAFPFSGHSLWVSE
jgi:hypothetical protein